MANVPYQTHQQTVSITEQQGDAHHTQRWPPDVTARWAVRSPQAPGIVYGERSHLTGSTFEVGPQGLRIPYCTNLHFSTDWRKFRMIWYSWEPKGEGINIPIWITQHPAAEDPDRLRALGALSVGHRRAGPCGRAAHK